VISILLRNNIVLLSIAFLFSLILPSMYSVQAQQGFLTYNDPQSRFTIQHPPDWEPHPAENRFATAEVELLKSDTSVGQLLDLDVRIIPDIDEEVVDDFGLERFMELATDGLQSSIPNFSLEQGIECETYSLSGNQACSIIYSRTMDYTSELEFAVLQVATAIGNNAYMLTYMGTVDDFDQNLPVVNQMIASFKVPDSFSGSSSDSDDDTEADSEIQNDESIF
jgi:hypothetical protein